VFFPSKYTATTEIYPLFPHHSLPSRAKDFALQRLPLLGFDQRRELAQPCRSLRRQDPHHGFRAGASCELAERVEHRVIRFLSSESFDALPTSAADAAILKCVEQSRLT